MRNVVGRIFLKQSVLIPFVSEILQRTRINFICAKKFQIFLRCKIYVSCNLQFMFMKRRSMNGKGTAGE